MTTHVIQLDRYCAKAEGVRGRLVLGTWQSYGLEQLQLVLGDGWAGRTVTAVFHGPRASIGTTVLAGSDGLVDVPQEATAAAGHGAITFMGVDADSQRISVDVPYMVIGHAPVTGQQPDPTPDIWQQFIAQTKADADRAEQAAGAASDSAAAAAKSAEAAAESAKQAEQAGVDIGAAKDDALEAIQQAQDTGVQAVEGATTTGVQAVQQAHQDAIDDIATDRQQALADIEDVGDKQQSAITSSGAAALEAIGQTEQAAIGQVEQAGTAQVTAVETAGQAQLNKINAANALVPTPTQADAGKAIIVKPDGSGYELGNAQVDAYAKAESDARYAPIEAAIRPTVSGNPATLDHSVAWAMQGLTVYGKSTQDGAPSPESPVPIVSAGESGSVELAVTGKNFLNMSRCSAFAKSYGLTPVVDGDSVLVSGTATVTMPIATFTILTTNDEFLVGRNFKFSWFTDQAIKSISGLETNNKINLAMSLQEGQSYNFALKISVGFEKLDAWEPYSGQSLTISTPNGLPGIPVDYDGNYTDASGQQWVCDEIDLKRGKYVKRIDKVVIDGEEMKFTLSSSGLYWNLPKWSAEGIIKQSAIVSMYFPRGIFSINTINDFIYTMPVLIGSYFLSTNDLNEFCTEKSAEGQPLELYYGIDPIETDLTAEDLTAYAALRTYDGTTVVATDAPVAGLSARYVADGAAYIESKIQSALALVNQAVLEAKTNV